ncbi:MAG: MFS transporter [Pseudomonadota bacterium]
MTQTAAIKRGDLISYALLALPLAFAGLPLYIHAPDFYATEAGLSLALMGTVLLVVRLFDAVQDPIIGYLSDKFSEYRFAFFLFGLIALCISFAMLFHPPSSYVLVWFALSIVLATTAFSVIVINLNAIGSLWTDETHDKTRITGWREGLGLVGLLIASIVPAVLIEMYEKTEAFAYFSYLSIALFVVVGFVFLRWLKSQGQSFSKSGSFTGFSFKGLFDQRRKNMFFGIYGLSMLASSIPAVLVIFFVRDRLDAESYTGLFLALYFLSGVAAMPLWQAIAKRKTKMFSWLIAMALAVATFIWAFFLGAGDIWAYAAVCLLSGIALGAELSLPPSILSDLVEDKKDQTSTNFAFLAFLNKAAFALGTGIAFLLLAWFAFEPATQNSDEALMGLSFTYALLPSVLKILAATLLIWGGTTLFQGDKNEMDERSDADGLRHSTNRM